jgi:hypothetical protein
MTAINAVTGGCLCGQARFIAVGEPVNVRICHCGLCRKASGGLMYGRAIFRAEDLERSGETKAHPSSARLLRHFCPQCGTLVYTEPVDRPGYWAVGLAALDAPEGLPPEMHIWVSSKPAWLKLDDGLPQHPQGVPW